MVESPLFRAAKTVDKVSKTLQIEDLDLFPNSPPANLAIEPSRYMTVP